jgi:nascent polypeptide-associated complex subunit beta
MDPAAVQAKLKSKFGSAPAPRAGGVRRKKVAAVRKNATQDDKKLQSALKRLNVQQIPGIEEVNMFKDNDEIIHFQNPKVQAAFQAHTYVISGQSETKSIMELFPSILSQLGPNNMETLKKLVGEYAKSAGGKDDEVPDLVDNFEAQAESDAPAKVEEVH